MWKQLGSLLETDSIVLGQEPTRLKQAGTRRYQQLLETYKNKKYLLESFKGQPYIVMKEGAEKSDSVAAVVQAVHLEKFRGGHDYQEILQAQGSDAADYWLVEKSLAKADGQVPGLVDRLHEKGWATDLIHFVDTDKRYSEVELNKPLAEGQIALP